MDSKIDKAWVLMDLGRLEGAREMLGEVLAGDPENALALAVMAEVALRMREPERALEYSATALRLMPDSTFVWRIRALAEGQVASGTEDPVLVRECRGRALDAAQRAVDLDPDDVDNLRILAATQRHSDPDAALRTLARALEIDPDNVRLHVLRGAVLRLNLPRNLRDPSSLANAEKAFHRALELEPENIEALFELGRIDLMRGDNEAAKDRFRLVARLDTSAAGAVREMLEWIAEEEQRLAQAEFEAVAEAEAWSHLRAAAQPPPGPFAAYEPANRPRSWWVKLVAGLIGLVILNVVIAGTSDTAPRRTPTRTAVPTYLPAPSFRRFPATLEPPFRDWPSNFPRPTYRTPPPSARTPPPTTPGPAVPPG
ncbi:tetratricopeptide repeat protein [Nocardia jejuensis]|uniref:tetratricopeptide repeat protein n=1 Tax=Nocardia jejuensis TaxID=328049 RepID=UPI000AD6C67C|nr:tetratricopeptide repeat protein [Nocardia jejuensis]